MNLNSQSSFYPVQPDNPSDKDRYMLAYEALTRKGWPEDFGQILKLMSPPPDITNYAKPGEFKTVRVCVIGGGLAGLAAAFELRKLGFDITVLDALEDRVGGRIYTYYFDRQKKFYNEFGPMRIPVIHETVWHYIKTFELPTRPFIQYNPNGFVYLKKTRVRYDAAGYNVAKYIYPEYPLRDWERSLSWQKLLAIGTDDILLHATPQDRAEILQVKPYYGRNALMWGDNSNIRMMQYAGLSQGAINLVTNFNPLLNGNLYNSFIDFIEEDYPANLTYLYEIPGGMTRLPSAFFDSFRDSSRAAAA
jgi:monoamine oxidase